MLNDLQMRIGSSIGIALYPVDGKTAAVTLLKNADTALYRAKADRRSGLHFFEALDGTATSATAGHWSKTCGWPSAPNNYGCNTKLVFVSATRSITGFEALAALAASDTGCVRPDGVYSDRRGNRSDHGNRRLGVWNRPAARPSTGPHQSGSRSICRLFSCGAAHHPPQVADILAPHRVARPSAGARGNGDHVNRRSPPGAGTTLQELRDLRVQMSCDDFGTGYSSFSHIQEFAFDRIKIDKSFVQELEITPSALRIVQAILAMARSLEMDVTAEGVETEGQFSLAARAWLR